MTVFERHQPQLRVVTDRPAGTLWMNHAQAATYLGVGENKLREMRSAWHAEHGTRVERRIGRRHVRFAASDLDDLAGWFSRHIDRTEQEVPRVLES